MKLRVKFAGKAFPVGDVPETTTVGDLKAIVGALLDIADFSMSLNGRDFFDDGTSLSNTLKEEGIVNGDTIYVALRGGGSETMAEYSPPVFPKSTTMESNRVTGPLGVVESKESAGMSGNKTASNPETSREPSYEKMLEEMKPQSAVEAIVICIHALLVDQGFHVTGVPETKKTELSPNWRHGLAFKIVQLEYRHPNSDVPLEISTLVQGKGEKMFAAITANCVLGDTPQIRKIDLNFKDFFPQPTSANFKSSGSPAMLCQRLRKELIEQLKHLVVGFPECPLLNLPYDIRTQLVRLIPVTAFRKLAETCKELKKLWDDDSLWRDLLLRDFKDEAVAEAERNDSPTKYRDCYKGRFVQWKERSRPRVEPHTVPNPPPGVTDPSSSYYPPPIPGGVPGMIGGGYDLNPHGWFPPTYPSGGVPARPGTGPLPYFPGARQPFGPRIRPVTPYNPDAGLFGPNPPGRHPRPRNPFSDGGNPFGGGPSFPGSRFL